MIVDTSALVAIIRGEPDRRAYQALIAQAPAARISAGTYVELGIVVDGPRDPVQSSSLDALLASARIRIEPFTASQAQIARTAYERFGRGSGHPARLNMGDCFAYALARELGEPLLFKGRDFALTDIELVTEPIRHRRLSEIIAAYGVGVP
ncbi:MAG TPA: type II toxin-antitoxin system VapC family toxin [Candidatus Sulfomarinibacteraceae bacterium]|nr:type II toxin-antitoxin system VapC family toxin [Candidatus Sulfomarinibacteraceae bacterium]